MKQTLAQLGLNEGTVTFRAYEFYSCSKLSNTVFATNYLLSVEANSKTYIFFSGARWKELHATEVGVLREGKELEQLIESNKPIFKDELEPWDQKDEVLMTITQLLDDNLTWIEEEVESLLAKHGLNASFTLAPEQITSATVSELKSLVAKAEQVLGGRK